MTRLAHDLSQAERESRSPKEGDLHPPSSASPKRFPIMPPVLRPVTPERALKVVAPRDPLQLYASALNSHKHPSLSHDDVGLEVGNDGLPTGFLS